MRALIHPYFLLLWLFTALQFTKAAEPQNRVSQEVVTKAAEEVRADEVIEDAKNSAKTFPLSGGLVRAVVPGSFAEKNGIKPGAVVLFRGRLEYGNSRNAFEPENKKELDTTEDELIWVSRQNFLMHAPIGRELAGITYCQQRNMTYWFLRHGQRDPRWDRLVVTALLSQWKNAATAESCWASACAAGYQPDALLHWSCMFLSAAQGDYQAADAHATAYGEIKRPLIEKDLPIMLSDWREIAYLTGNMQLLLKATLAFPPYEYDKRDAQRLAELQKQAPSADAPPSVLASRMKRRSFVQDGSPRHLPNWLGTQGYQEVMEKAIAADKAGKADFPPLEVLPEEDEFSAGLLAPMTAARDMDVEIEYQAKGPAMNPEAVDQQSGNLLFGIVNLVDAKGGHFMIIPGSCRTLVAVLAQPPIGANREPGWLVYAPCRTNKGGDLVWESYDALKKERMTCLRPPFQGGPDSWHKLRIVRVNGWAEALVDGKRIALTPVPATSVNSCLFLRTFECSVTVKSIKGVVLE